MMSLKKQNHELLFYSSPWQNLCEKKLVDDEPVMKTENVETTK